MPENLNKIINFGRIFTDGGIRFVKRSSKFNVELSNYFFNYSSNYYLTDARVNWVCENGIVHNRGDIASEEGASICNDGDAALRLDNAQPDLTFQGVLPKSYNIIIHPQGYGRCHVTAGTGAMLFDIYKGDVSNSSASVLKEGLFLAVLSGVGIHNIDPQSLSGTYDDFKWVLRQSCGASDVWDMVVDPLYCLQDRGERNVLRKLLRLLRRFFSLNWAAPR